MSGTTGLTQRVFITDHSADLGKGTRPAPEVLCRYIKACGGRSVRYDWRWELIEPKPCQPNIGQLRHYMKAKQQMDGLGLEPPAVVLSSLPKWARGLYGENKTLFLDSWLGYLELVRDRLERAGGPPVERIQVLNELNNWMFGRIALEDVLSMASIARQVFMTYSPNIKVMVTLLASKRLVGRAVDTYLKKLEKIPGWRSCVDVIGLDYYPGFWNWPVWQSHSLRPSHQYDKLGRLREIFERVGGLGVEYELAEVGLPCFRALGGESGQVRFYKSFLGAYRELLLDMHGRGLPLPSRLGIYQIIDEGSPPWEYFGLLRSDGTPKEIAKPSGPYPTMLSRQLDGIA